MLYSAMKDKFVMNVRFDDEYSIHEYAIEFDGSISIKELKDALVMIMRGKEVKHENIPLDK